MENFLDPGSIPGISTILLSMCTLWLYKWMALKSPCVRVGSEAPDLLRIHAWNHSYSVGLHG